MTSDLESQARTKQVGREHVGERADQGAERPLLHLLPYQIDVEEFDELRGNETREDGCR